MILEVRAATVLAAWRGVAWRGVALSRWGVAVPPVPCGPAAVWPEDRKEHRGPLEVGSERKAGAAGAALVPRGRPSSAPPPRLVAEQHSVCSWETTPSPPAGGPSGLQRRGPGPEAWKLGTENNLCPVTQEDSLRLTLCAGEAT